MTCVNRKAAQEIRHVIESRRKSSSISSKGAMADANKDKKSNIDLAEDYLNVAKSASNLKLIAESLSTAANLGNLEATYLYGQGILQGTFIVSDSSMGEAYVKKAAERN